MHVKKMFTFFTLSQKMHCLLSLFIFLMAISCAAFSDSSVSKVEPIRFNQLGFYLNGPKVAVIVKGDYKNFEIIDQENKVAYKSKLSKPKIWLYSEEEVQIADFSRLRKPGKYRLKIPNLELSKSFTIGNNVLHDAHKASLKAFYFNRAGFTLKPPHAQQWVRKAGHLDDLVYVHKSAANKTRPEGFEISAPKGWYDAGDFNKYIVNSGITTFTLLSAYEQFPEFYKKAQFDIPESSNNLPDILDEVLWNIEWMLAMQDPSDGGVYHKLTSLNFDGTKMPSDATSKRYVVQKTTAAALNFTAVMAVAARVYEPFDPKLSEQLKAASLKSWAWAKQFNSVAYVQPKDVFTGQYDQKRYKDEFSWAAAELAITFNRQSFYEEHRKYSANVNVPSWNSTAALAHISLLLHSKNNKSFINRKYAKKRLLLLADKLDKYRKRESAYGVTQGQSYGDFSWGSNGTALNQSMILIVAYLETKKKKYLDSAIHNVDYVLGRNPLAISYITGYGYKSPMHIHHRVSAADNVKEPIPGLVVGGPHSGQQDKCDYASKLPAKSYLDDYCSYSTNEVAINWNAPLVYVLGALEVLMNQKK